MNEIESNFNISTACNSIIKITFLGVENLWKVKIQVQNYVIQVIKLYNPG